MASDLAGCLFLADASLGMHAVVQFDHTIRSSSGLTCMSIFPPAEEPDDVRQTDLTDLPMSSGPSHMALSVQHTKAPRCVAVSHQTKVGAPMLRMHCSS